MRASAKVLRAADRMRYQRVLSCFLPSLLASGLLAACGPVTYTLDVTDAERVVARARAENAGYYAPYDLYFAEAHLDKAREEAAQGRYEDAIRAAAVALSHGRRALTRSAQPGPSAR
jgi:Domain of unknown function (DUF4398)